jgi:glycosyltransferase involved in cell wall biosynthesis
LSTRYFGSADESKKKVIRGEIARIRSQCRNTKQPHLMFFGDVLFDDMMPSLYTASDCYVLVTRGEGFGLPFIEAASCGLPVIASRYSGQTDFLDDENSWLVDVDGFQSAGRDLAWISYFYEDAEFPIFGPAAVEQTRHFMRQAFENKEEREKKAALLSAKIRGEYDWSNAVSQMHAKLKDTFDKWR